MALMIVPNTINVALEYIVNAAPSSPMKALKYLGIYSRKYSIIAAYSSHLLNAVAMGKLCRFILGWVSMFTKV